MKHFLTVENLSFTYENCVEPLFQEISFQLEQGWTGIVGPNGSGKTTLLKLVCGLLQSDSGTIIRPGVTYYSEQRTDFPPADFQNLFQSNNKQIHKIKHSLQISDNWQHHWDVLSHGERKRCQIAVALQKEPLVLAIDEPSNHLDVRSKDVLLHALESCRGIGLLVSHDRALMDALCHRTLFIYPPIIDVRKCHYSLAVKEREREHQSRIDNYVHAKREIKKLKRKVQKQREKTSRSDKRKSKRHLNPKDHDAKAKKDLARLTGKDSVDGRIFKRMQSKLTTLQTDQKKIDFKETPLQGIVFQVEEDRRMFPVIIPSQTLSLGDEKALSTPELTFNYGDKIGIVGDNGSGKSTFLDQVILELKIPAERLIYIPQEIPADMSKSILKRVQTYDGDQKGQILTIVRRLGSDPVHILESSIPSPGEVRKLMLAEGIMRNPSLILMDEPTNHMDLTAIECVESALNECGCAQLLVSHDLRFLENTVDFYWVFSERNSSDYTVTVQSRLDSV